MWIHILRYKKCQYKYDTFIWCSYSQIQMIANASLCVMFLHLVSLHICCHKLKLYNSNTSVFGAALSPHSQRGSDPGHGGPSLWSLHVLPLTAWVPSGFSGILPQSKDVQLGLLDSKLPVGVNLSVSALRWTGDLSRVYPPLATLNRMSGSDNGIIYLFYLFNQEMPH